MVSPTEFVKTAEKSQHALTRFEDSMLLTKRAVAPESDAPNWKQTIAKMNATTTRMDAYVQALGLHKRMVARAFIRANGGKVVAIRDEERSPEVLMKTMHTLEKAPLKKANPSIKKVRTAMRKFEEILLGVTEKEPNETMAIALKNYQKILDSHEILAIDTLLKLRGFSGNLPGDTLRKEMLTKRKIPSTAKPLNVARVN